ncbi:MAG: hypothetical protein E7077_14280 [Bacteroidales bacterium]|jgi:hypothetical protein|nr:hypothetical protein [Bacteroidales bacterium]
MKKFILIIGCSFITLCSFATGQTSGYYNRIKKDVEQIAAEFKFQYDSIIVFSNDSRHLIITNKNIYDEGKLLGLEMFQGRTVNDTLIFEKFDETDSNLPCTFSKEVFKLNTSFKCNFEEDKDYLEQVDKTLNVLSIIENGNVKCKHILEQKCKIDNKYDLKDDIVGYAILLFLYADGKDRERVIIKP